MTHFGILCPASDGHLNPMITLGCELLRRGHRVTVFNLLDAKAKTLASGLEFQALAADKFPTGLMTEEFREVGKLSGIAAFKKSIQLLIKNTKIILETAPTAIQNAGIEALLVDQISWEGGTVAERLNLPFITVCNALILHPAPDIPPFFTLWSYSTTWQARLRNKLSYQFLSWLTRPLREQIFEYRRQWNLPLYPPGKGYESSLAQISQEPAEFEFPRSDLPPHFYFTGPYHNRATRKAIPFPFERLNGKPLIYASMGTIQNRLLDIFQIIAAACEEFDVQLVISLGGGATPEALQKLPGNPIVVGYAPQLELLPKAALVITHAGLNTTLESLSYGVPMVAVPVTNDQPGVAARIAWTGVGEVIPLKQLSISKMRDAIGKVLTDDAYKKRAIALQKAIHHQEGTSRAADIIEQVVSVKTPVLAQR